MKRGWWIALALTGAVATGTTLPLGGCSVTVDSGGTGGDDTPSSNEPVDNVPSNSFTLSNKSIDVPLGVAGVFDLLPGATITNIADVVPFDRPPDDSPVAAVIRIRPESVIIETSDSASGKLSVQAAGVPLDGQRWTGSLEMQVWIARLGAMNRCEDGTYVGAWFLGVANNVVTEVKYGSVGALGGWMRTGDLQLFLDNGFSLCLQTNATTSTSVSDPDAVRGTVTFQGLEITFGPNNTATYVDLPEEPTRPGTTEACCRPPLYVYYDHKEPRVQFCEDVAHHEIRGTSKAQCEQVGGIWKGPGSSCGSMTCNEEFRVCCLSMKADASTPCAEYPEEYCVDPQFGIQGTLFPPGLTCENPTPLCTGDAQACCLADGTCQNVPMSHPDLCPADGKLQGLRTQCHTVTCPSGPVTPEKQACCLPTGLCNDVSPDTCDAVRGKPQGPGSRCNQLTCPLYGACCSQDATCNLRTRAECLALQSREYAVYRGDNTSCNPNLCERPAGACCDRNGNCNYVEDQQCIAPDKFLGGSSSCEPNLCQAVRGACCDAMGHCADDTEFHCNSEHNSFLGENTVCTPGICPPPLGGCCIPDQPCSMTSAEDCVQLKGRYLGDGVQCSVPACAPPPEYVVWYTGNVCCWWAPRINVTDRAEFNRPEVIGNVPGGGTDYQTPLVRVELQGGFVSIFDANAWLCPKVTSKSFHYWCRPYHYQMDGKNWILATNVTCDTNAIPETATPPADDVCP